MEEVLKCKKEECGEIENDLEMKEELKRMIIEKIII